MRRGGHLRPPGSGQAGVPGAVRLAAPRPGERGHLHHRRRPDLQPQIHGARGRYLHQPGAGHAAGRAGHRPHALFHRRRYGAAQRAAVFGGVQQGPRGRGAQRQHHQRCGIARRPGAPRLHLPGIQRHRSHPAPGGALFRAHPGGRAARCAAATGRRVFAGIPGAGPRHRGARSAWFPPAGGGRDGNLRRPQGATSSPRKPAPST